MTNPSPQNRQARVVWLVVAALMVTALLGAAPVVAQSNVTIGFDGLPNAAYTGHTEDGFTVVAATSTKGWSVVNLVNLSPPLVDQRATLNTAIGAGEDLSGALTLTKSGGGAFTFVSADGVIGSPPGGANQTMKVEGFLNGTAVGSDTFNLTGAGQKFTASNLTGVTVNQLRITLQKTLQSTGGAPQVDNIVLGPLACADSITVGTEADLNAAIACFNARTTAGVATITLTKDITLTASTTEIKNATAGASLAIEGAGFAVDGQKRQGTRIFKVAASTTATFNAITIKGGQTIGLPGGPGLQSEGNVTLRNSTVTGNQATDGGGAVTTLAGTLLIENSTISNNTNFDGSGGGLRLDSDATLRNTTVSGNSVTVTGPSAGPGGGVIVGPTAGKVVFDSVTIANNTAPNGAGFALLDLSAVDTTFVNTIVAGNTGAQNAGCSAPITDGGHNFIQSDSGCGFANGVNGTVVGQAADLGPLADNGGDTQTHLPNAGSPVINAGATTLGADQRGVARPQGPADDIGAVEAVLPGTIRIVKVAQPQGATAFNFTLGGIDVQDFTLVDDGLGTRNTFTSTQTPGTFVVTENAQSGWFVSNIVCDDADSTVDIAARKATIRLGSQETVTCTYTNSKLGSLTIVKKTSGGDGTFSYSSPQLGPFRLTTQKKTAQRTFIGVAPGAYNVSEAPTQGWDLTNASCSNGSNPASITVAPGEDVTCSFTNVKRGSITVVKSSAGGDGTFPFTSTTLGGVNAAAAGGFSLTTVGGTAQRTFDNLLAGTYDLAENTPAGWQLTSATCSDGSTLPNVNVAAGEDVTCTFANAKQGSLTVVKQATGEDATFPFTSTALGAFDLTTVNGTAQRTFANLNPGAFDLAENLPGGWQQTDATCSDGSTLPTVDVGAGEDVTCTFANTQADTILAIKLALGGDDAFPFTSTALGAFTLTTTSGYAVQAFTGLTPGAYALAETPLSGWTMAEADPTCSNGDKASAITLGTGETIVCLFVNYKPDTIIVEKRTVGGDGSFGFTSNLPGAGSFSLTTVNGVASQTFTGLAPATYNIAETPQAGWTQTGARCDNGATPDNIVLAAGATVRCVFTDTKLSSITVVKTTTGGDGSFAFTGSLGNFSLATVSGTAQRVFANVLGGSYRISETVPAGWRLTGAGCTDGSNPGNIALSPGENVTCTFANAKGGSLAVVVNTTDGNGAFGFTSTALGSFVITTTAGTGQQSFANLTPGAYDLTETSTPGWDLGLATCSNGSNPASVSVAAGEAVVCTFENINAQTAMYFPIVAKQ